MEVTRMQLTESFDDARKERAREILASSEPRMISDDTFIVPSQSRNAEYVVKLSDFYTCNCPDFLQRCKDRGLYCKHIQAVLLLQRLKRRANRIQGLQAGGAEC
jgi:predicted nucleic acid-binding Zn finger protein